jgi:XTP/dITP diphosphohydrolase
MKPLLIATNNPGKLLEIQSALGDLEAELLTPQQLGLALDVEEDGETYRENAARKAVAFAIESGTTALADDTGLEVEALDGKPGLYSARFSPLPRATDADRRAYLLSLLKGVPRPWKATFHCAVAVVDPQEWQWNGQVHFSEGLCKGEIVPEERGAQGFGYDRIFRVAGQDRTMAELTLEEKNSLSHRGRAVRGAIPLLKTILKGL